MEPCCLSPNTCRRIFGPGGTKCIGLPITKANFVLAMSCCCCWEGMWTGGFLQCALPGARSNTVNLGEDPASVHSFPSPLQILVVFGLVSFFFLMHLNFTVLFSNNYSIFCFPPWSPGLLHSSGWAARMLEQLPGKLSNVQKQHRRHYYGFWVLHSTVFSTAWSCCSAMFFGMTLF